MHFVFKEGNDNAGQMDADNSDIPLDSNDSLMKQLFAGTGLGGGTSLGWLVPNTAARN